MRSSSALCLLLPGLVSCAYPYPNTDIEKAAIQKEVEGTPALPNWRAYIPKLPSLGRPLRVASPCCGIHGTAHALDVMNVPYQCNNIFDLDASYGYLLEKHLRLAGMQNIELHLGKKLGNMLEYGLEKLAMPVDVLMAGPPCPPWAGQGSKKSHQDARFKVFCRVLEWVYMLAKCGGLLCAILENVEGITWALGGREPMMTMLLRIVTQMIPEFAWGVDTCYLPHYGIPHTRTRVFLRGIRRSIADAVPPVLPKLGIERTLHDVLGKFPNIIRSGLTWPQKNNITSYERMIRAKFADGALTLADWVVFAYDRAADRVYKQQLTKNLCPTLTTNNKYLMVADVAGVVNRVPDAYRRIFRPLMNTERLALQGFEPSIAIDLRPASAFKAAGNAYPIPLVLATLMPLLQAVADSGMDFRAWPDPSMISRELPQGLDVFRKELKKKPKVLKNEVRPMAKSRKRRRSF